MKKLLSVLLLVVMVLSAVSCTAAKTTEAPKTAEKTTEKVDLVKVKDIALTDEQYAYAVKKGNTELLNSLNTFLAEIKGNGTFDAIVNKYFGDGTPTAVTVASEMKQDGSQLIVATNASFAPFEYMEGDSYYGLDMEIMGEFAKYLNRELYIYNMEFASVCLSVGGDENTESYCDIGAAALTVNDTRKQTLDFSESYYNASQMLVVKADNTAFDACQTAEDVLAILNTYDANTKCGTQAGTTGYYFCAGDADWGFDGFKFTTTGFTTAALAVQALVNGNLDLVIVDEGPAKMITASVNAAN